MTIVYKTLINLFFMLFITAGGLQSTQAFDIVPKPSATSVFFVPSISYKLNNGKDGIITRQPIGFVSIKRGGTDDFLRELRSEFPESKGWKFLAAEDDLKGSFVVGAYYVVQSGGPEVMGCGGSFAFDYVPSDTDSVSNRNTELHWIQRITSNHKKGEDHGILENSIISKKSNKLNERQNVPFFDIVTKGFKSRSIPPHYEYDAGKVDPENNHQWNAEVYLVSINKSESKTVTIYNGVSWGWENKVLIEPPLKVGIDLKTQP